MLVLCTAYSEPLLIAESSEALFDALLANEDFATEAADSISPEDFEGPYPRRIVLLQQRALVRELVPYSPREHGGGLLEIGAKPTWFRGHKLSNNTQVQISNKGALLYRHERLWACAEQSACFVGPLTAAQAYEQIIAQLRQRKDEITLFLPPGLPRLGDIQLEPLVERGYGPVFVNAAACIEYLGISEERLKTAMEDASQARLDQYQLHHL